MDNAAARHIAKQPALRTRSRNSPRSVRRGRAHRNGRERLHFSAPVRKKGGGWRFLSPPLINPCRAHARSERFTMANSSNRQNHPDNLPESVRIEAERILAVKRAKKEKAGKIRRIVLRWLLPAAALVCIGLVLYETVLDDALAYGRAKRLLEQGSCAAAAERFQALGGYKDSRTLAKEAGFALAVQQYEAGELETARQTLVGLYGFGESDAMIARIDCDMADAAVDAQDYLTALRLYERAGEYGGAAEKAGETRLLAYERAVSLADAGDALGALSLFVAIPEIRDSAVYAQLLGPSAARVFAAGHQSVLALKAGGGVYATGGNSAGQLTLTGWDDLIDLAAGYRHTVGLKSDGTVLAAGDDTYGQCGVSGWTDIVDVTAAYMHTVGLTADGAAVAAGDNEFGQCDVAGWTGISAVAAGYMHTVGLKSDGTLVAAGSNDDGQCDVAGWSAIVMVAAGPYHTIGLKSDGTLVAAGDNTYGQCEIEEYTDVIAVSTAEKNTLLLKSDGTAYSVGDTSNEQNKLAPYAGVIAVLASDTECSVLLKNDGTVSVAGKYIAVPSVAQWQEIGLPPQ